MPIIRWDNEYSVGIERIDEEHKTLIHMINRAFDSTSETDETIRQLVRDMQEYAVNHFETEDAFMADYGFPEANTHLESHDEFRQYANADGKHDPIKLIQYLAKWLNSHIIDEDKALGRFLQSKGVR